MIKNILISLIIFTSLSSLWLSSLSNETLNITSIEKKLYQATTSPPFIGEILSFILGIIILLIYIGVIIEIASKNLHLVTKNNISKMTSTFILWCSFIFITFGLSSKLYPNIFFSHTSWDNKYIIYTCSLFFLSLILLTFFTKKNRCILSLIIFTLCAPYFIPSKNDDLKEQSINKPNIIIIGIDSFNTENINKESTPFIHSFIHQSLYLPNTYTHVARTFPAWFSIISGKYPLNSKARLNLTEFNQLELDETLPKILKDNGYNTYYIQDERRFNNINEEFYFDNIIGPPASSAEFILSKFVDLPFLALSTELLFFEYFMPHIQNNRGVWTTYNEKKFNKSIFKKLKERNGHYFIASHFTLPHWPYKTSEKILENKNTEEKYLNTLKKVDKQVEEYVSFLKVEGYLKNAMVFLISDHGESFGRINDTPINTEKKLNLAGHGTSVISQTQYRVLLAIRNYGEIQERCPLIADTKLNFALSDIAPTIIDCLNIRNKTYFDGTSIYKASTQRVIPLESSLQPFFNSDGEIDINGTITRNSNLYRVNKEGKVVIKKELYSNAVNSKQRSIIFDKWQFSYFPEWGGEYYITDLENNELFSFKDFNNTHIKRKLLNFFCDEYNSEINLANLTKCKNKTYKNLITRLINE